MFRCVSIRNIQVLCKVEIESRLKLSPIIVHAIFYLSNHGQPDQKPDATDKGGKHFLAVATPQMSRKQINDACDDALDTYKLDAKKTKLISME